MYLFSVMLASNNNLLGDYSSKLLLLAVSKISVTAFPGSAVSLETMTAVAIEQIKPGTIS